MHPYDTLYVPQIVKLSLSSKRTILNIWHSTPIQRSVQMTWTMPDIIVLKIGPDCKKKQALDARKTELVIFFFHFEAYKTEYLKNWKPFQSFLLLTVEHCCHQNAAKL